MSETFKDITRRLSGRTSIIAAAFGIRKGAYVELALTFIGALGALLSYLVFGQGYTSMAIGGAALLLPLLTNYSRYYWYRRVGRRVIPQPQVPLITVIISALMAFVNPYLTPFAVVNAAHVEDFLSYFSYVDISGVKRQAWLMLEPFRRSELATLLGLVAASSLAAFMITHAWEVFIYPVASYGLMAYSVLNMPYQETGHEEVGERPSLSELLIMRIPALYFLMYIYMTNPKMMALAKQAGVFGAAYFRFVRRSAGLFVLSAYLVLALAPLVYLVASFIGMPWLSYVIVVAVPAMMFAVPIFRLNMMKSARAGKITRNILLILSYLASTAAVAESFTGAMEYLFTNKGLAKLFGLEKESEIYMNIYTTSTDEYRALHEYAESLPNDFYRDTVMSFLDLVENEGYGAAFNMLVNRLREYTTREITRISMSFENVAGNLISTIILLETTLPVIAFMSSPIALPILMLMGGVLSAVVIAFIVQSVMPDMPSEFVNVKRRLLRGGALSAITATALTIAERYMLPQMIDFLAIVNVIVGIGVAFWYASLYDLALNRDFLTKFQDLLDLFGNSISRTNSVERSLMELASERTFTARMKAEFMRLANTLGIINIEKLEYKGVYWFKYFLFLASLATRYGTAPRTLYKAISEFTLELKRFFAHVDSFGKSLMFLTLISLFVMTLEARIMLALEQVLAASNIQSALAQFGVSAPIPIISGSQLASLTTMTYISLIVAAVANGFALGKAISNTFRDGKWVLFLYLIQIVLVFVGIKTNFGISFGATNTTSSLVLTALLHGSPRAVAP